MRLAAIFLVLGSVAAGILGPQFLFVVDETQAAIVTRFGEARRSISEPGLYVKSPFVDTVTYFDKRRRLFDAPPDSLLTSDKKRLVVDVYAIVRVDDPLAFFKKVRSEQGAVSATIPIIGSALREEIARDEQSMIIRTSRESIMNKVTTAVTPLVSEFGLTVVDVRMKRTDFPPEIADSIYERMKAERQRIANQFRAEGVERDNEIRADVDRQATIISAEAERDANRLRGEGEAEAIDTFRKAIEGEQGERMPEGPEFFAFRRSLEAYGKFLGQNATLVLPADSDVFRFLSSSEGVAGRQAPASPAPVLRGLAAADGAAFAFLSASLGADAGTPVLQRAERVEWPDAGLGCPVEGSVYAQVVTQGYALGYTVDGTSHEVHANLDGTSVVSCD